MIEARLDGKEKRVLCLWIVLGLLGAWFAHRYFFQAFPEASVDFKVSRSEAQKRARTFLENLSEDLSGYQSTIVFEVDENAKTYLERELSLAEANRLMSTELEIWYWDVRFFRPLEEQEFHVQVSPAGRVEGYERKIPEAQGGLSLTREEALLRARQFLENRLGMALDNWEFLAAEANSVARPKRLDWSFTWELKDFRAKDAPYRLGVDLQGDHVGRAQEFLKVPEAWQRDYRHLRSTNDLYTALATVPYVLLMGAAVWLGISLTRQGKTSWRGAFWLGLVVALLFFLMQLNEWQSIRAGYDTHDAYASFVTRQIALLVLAALATALSVTLVLPGGEPLYREAQPTRLRLSAAFRARGIRSKEFFCAAVVGLSLAAAHIGFIVLFYRVGRHFGVWAPQDLNYSNVVNTSFPWISGVAIGFLAATSEEFLFRLFAIPFLHKLTGSRFLAVLLPAFMWSFLHSNYPQEPGYIRGIEVGLIGIVAGLVLLRWGIVATLVWHYTVDALLVGMLLIRSDNLYFKTSGILVGLAAFAPLLFSGLQYLLRGGFEPVDDLQNAAEAVGEIDLVRQVGAEKFAVKKRLYAPLRKGALGFLVLCFLVGSLLAWRLKREQIGDYLRLSTDPHSAVRLADAVLREHGQDPAAFHRVAQFVDNTDPVVNEFLHRRMSVSAINKIYAGPIPGTLWRVRYFRDAQPEEFAVTLKPDGSPHAYWHKLPEAANGANLSKEEAVALAEKFLREKKQLALTEWTLVEAKSDNRPHRTDHTLVWQQNTPLGGGVGAAQNAPDNAYARVELQILGDEPADYRTFVKIPEEFKRQQEEETLPRTLFFVGRLVLGVGLIATVLGFYFKSFRERPNVAVPWRRMLAWGGAGAVAFAVSVLCGNALALYLGAYRTELSLNLYYATVAVGVLLQGAFVVGALVLLFGLAWYFGARAFGEERIPLWFGMRGEYYLDASLLGLGGTAALLGLQRLLALLPVWWPVHRRALPAQIADFFDATVPGLGLFGSALLHGLFASALLGLAAAFVGAELSRRWVRGLLFFAIAAALVSNWGSPADFAEQFLAKLLLLAFLAFGIWRLARFNVLGLFLIGASAALLPGGSALLAQPDPFYRSQGFTVLAAMLFLLLGPLLLWRLRSAIPAESGQAGLAP